MPLTVKQERFVEAYIKLGNATQAAIEAGYKVKNARKIGSENLTKLDISTRIKERLEEIDRSRIAEANEVMRFYTAVMRGEIKDQFDIDASLADRLKAGAEIMKRYAAAGYAAGSKPAEDDALTASLRELAQEMDDNADQ